MVVMARKRPRKMFVTSSRPRKVSVIHKLIQTSDLADLLLSWLQPDEVAIFSAVAKAMIVRAKHDRYWMSVAACGANGRNDPKLQKIFQSFVSRGYSHPWYRVFCWTKCSYSDAQPDVRLQSNESISTVSCVWRHWVFVPARANGWTTERRLQVWVHYLENNYKLWYPLQKTYIVGFYDRTPRNPFLLTMGPDVETDTKGPDVGADTMVLRTRTVSRTR